mgnify:CR=1 FL=1
MEVLATNLGRIYVESGLQLCYSDCDVAIDLLNLADHLDYMGVDTSFFDCKKGAGENDVGPVPMMLVV